MAPTSATTEVATSFRITEATPAFTRKSDLIVTPALNQLRYGQTTIKITHSNAHTLNISHGKALAKVMKLTPWQVGHVQPISLEQLTSVSSNQSEANHVINELFQTPVLPVEKRWHPLTLNPIERRNYDEIQQPSELEKLDHTFNHEKIKSYPNHLRTKTRG